MGGLLKYIASLCALTNPSTNSSKSLVPGFEAPVMVGYTTCNPYLCYAALLMAGLDSVKNQIDPYENGWDLTM